MKPALIKINTTNNLKAANLLDFLEIIVSDLNDYIFVPYEDVDQIPSICRLLIDAGVDIREISAC